MLFITMKSSETGQLLCSYLSIFVNWVFVNPGRSVLGRKGSDIATVFYTTQDVMVV